MLSSITTMINKAYENKYAVPHFNFSSVESARYILEACEEMSSPVIMAVSEPSISYLGGYNIAAAIINNLIKDLELTIPVGLLLDHGSGYESCEKAIKAGFNGVMVSANDINLADNVELTNKVIEMAKPLGIYVEGEVGDIGRVGMATVVASAEEAVALTKATDIDSLAPSLGSSHGIYEGEVHLDFDAMTVITENTKIPLVLHGGSGIPDHMIIRAIENGVAKINVNTDFQVAWMKGVKEYIQNNPDAFDPRKINPAGKEYMQDVAKAKILLFGSNYKA